MYIDWAYLALNKVNIRHPLPLEVLLSISQLSRTKYSQDFTDAHASSPRCFSMEVTLFKRIVE